jgi:hypothetical protein
MNMDGPEQDKVYWTIWGAMVAVITVAIIVGVVIA